MSRNAPTISSSSTHRNNNIPTSSNNSGAQAPLRGAQAPLRSSQNPNRSQTYQSVQGDSSSSSTGAPLASSQNRGASAGITLSATTTQSVVKPVYRQYIYDRVSGNSYVPRQERPLLSGDNKPLEDDRDESNNDNGDGDNGITTTTSVKASMEPPKGSLPTSSLSWYCAPRRPIHFLCYVPLCVRRCPGVMEDNGVCRCIGRVGCDELTHHRGWRRRVFLVAIAFNVCSVILIAWASMAFSTNHGILQRASFWRGQVWVPNQRSNETWATLNLGFRSIAIDLSNGHQDEEPISSFGDFCHNNDGSNSTTSGGSGSPSDNIFSLAYCGECQAETYITMILFNLFIVIRNIMYDHTRMYPTYDLNCPSFHGKILSVASVTLGLVTINTYHKQCFQKLENNVEEWYTSTYDTSGQELHWNWWPGPGMICLMVATFLRFIDMACNFLFPAPTIARDKEEQRQYELEFGEISLDDDDGGSNRNASTVGNAEAGREDDEFRNRRMGNRREEFVEEADNGEAGENS